MRPLFAAPCIARPLIGAFAIWLAAGAAPALAQIPAGPPAPTPPLRSSAPAPKTPDSSPAATPVSADVTGPEEPEKVKQVFVYGDDPCPRSTNDEIVVCARMPDGDRYRIPKELRDNPNAPENQSWGARARSLEYVGASGVDSCSPTGAGGFTGCFQKMARQAHEERETTLGKAGWADAVAAARAKRLEKIDAESKTIEAEARAREADAATEKAKEAAALKQMNAQDAKAKAANKAKDAQAQPDNPSTPAQQSPADGVPRAN